MLNGTRQHPMLSGFVILILYLPSVVESHDEGPARVPCACVLAALLKPRAELDLGVDLDDARVGLAALGRRRHRHLCQCSLFSAIVAFCFMGELFQKPSFEAGQ